MRYAVNSREMKQIDDYTIQTLRIPQTVLMERAAGQIAAVMVKRLKKDDRILIVCGPGNNGGDGIAAGRILFLQGYHVAILFIGEAEKTSAGFQLQMEAASKLNILQEHSDRLPEYNIIVDAIFGVGLSRPVTGEFERIINAINDMDGTVYSVDIPSGISADNGSIQNTAVRADYTITFGYQKRGLLLYPGAEYAGEITVADIGFPKLAEEQAKPDTVYYEREDLALLPVRKSYSNKGTYGKVLVIAGSKGMSGAAYLSAKAAYRTGAGLVKILTSEWNRVIVQTSLPEALFAAYDESMEPSENERKVIDAISWASVIVIGPGLGLSQTAKNLLKTVLNTARVPVIADADAITLLAQLINEKEQSRLQYLSSLTYGQLIVTPHLMELSRLIGIPVSNIVNNLVDTVYHCSYNNNLIYAVKDARTIVTQEDRRYINVSGNNGMATGGSGDVLTGIIAALIAQKMPPFEAVCLAVYIHGLAGDEAARLRGYYSLMAGDIVDSIEKVLNLH